LSEMELKRASQVRAKSVTYRDTLVLAGLHGYAFWQVSGCFEALTSTFRIVPSALTRRSSQVRVPVPTSLAISPRAQPAALPFENVG
jgi:hypothetical protein